MVQKSRDGLVSFAFWTTKEIRHAVKQAALDRGKSVQDMMTEAVAEWLERHERAKAEAKKG